MTTFAQKTASQKYTLSNKIYRFNLIVDVKNDARTNFYSSEADISRQLSNQSINYSPWEQSLFLFLTEEYKKKTLPLSGQAFEVAEARHSGPQFLFNSNET